MNINKYKKIVNKIDDFSMINDFIKICIEKEAILLKDIDDNIDNELKIAINSLPSDLDNVQLKDRVEVYKSYIENNYFSKAINNSFENYLNIFNLKVIDNIIEYLDENSKGLIDINNKKSIYEYVINLAISNESEYNNILSILKSLKGLKSKRFKIENNGDYVLKDELENIKKNILLSLFDSSFYSNHDDLSVNIVRTRTFDYFVFNNNSAFIFNKKLNEALCKIKQSNEKSFDILTNIAVNSYEQLEIAYKVPEYNTKAFNFNDSNINILNSNNIESWSPVKAEFDKILTIKIKQNPDLKYFEPLNVTLSAFNIKNIINLNITNISVNLKLKVNNKYKKVLINIGEKINNIDTSYIHYSEVQNILNDTKVFNGYVDQMTI